jgi:hypothetical protein
MQAQNKKTETSNEISEKHYMKIIVLFIISLAILLGCILTIQNKFEELEKRLLEINYKLLSMESK